MKISIITVCFNSGKTLEESILSVLSQTHNDVEYVVIDGGSTDSSLQIIEKYKDKIAVHLSEPDKGIYDAMNKGVSLCTGDFVGILNSDDVYSTNEELQKIDEQFRLNSAVSCVFGNVEFRDFNTGSLIRSCSARNFKPFKLRFGWMPPHPASFIKRSVYVEHGLYSLEYKISADYERFVNWLLVKKVKFVTIDRTVVHMRLGGASTSGFGSIYTLNKEIVKACKVNGIYTNFGLLLFKLPFKLFEFFPLIRKSFKKKK